jgi:integrase
MAKIMKRTVDALQPEPYRDVFAWDSELRGFGVRVKPSGVKTFLIQYRNAEGRTRRLVLGQYGALAPEAARDLAREKLTAVAKGEDPSAERHAVRAGMSVADVCDWYLDQAEAGRTVGTLRGLLGHAARLNIIGKNPAAGVRQLAVERRQRRLSEEELRHLGQVVRSMAAEGEHPTGLAAIRVMLLSGFRRMEVLGLERSWVSPGEHCVRFPDTKSGAQIRVLGRAAISCLESTPSHEGSAYLFPADWGDGHFIGVVRVLDRVCKKAKLKDVTPHVLRHTFASVAGDLGFSELTIAGLLGHSARGVTQGYVHLDTALVVAADRVSARIAELLDGAVASAQRKKGSRKEVASALAA